MGKKTWFVIALIVLVCMAGVAVLSFVMGGCGGMLTCGESQVPMKCHWTFRVTGVLGILGVVEGILAATAKTKEARTHLAICLALTGIVVLLVLFCLIGVCAKAGMSCIGHRTVITIVTVVGIIVALIGLAFADPAKADRPKQRF